MRFERQFTVPARPEAIWKLIANTDSLNREIGLPSVAYAVQQASEGRTRILARASAFGQELEWVEHPFEWTAPQEYVVQREFNKGPFHSVRAGVRLAPDEKEPGKTRVLVYADVEPRGFIGKMGATIGISRNVEQVRAATEQFAKFLNQELATPYPRRAGKVRLDAEALEAARRRVLELGAPEAPLARVCEFLAAAPDEDVRGMRPFELADRWRADRIETLRLFLLGTRAGLLEMTWNVLCPCCRVPKHEYPRMQELRSQSRCDYCEMGFSADLDRLVEVRFTVHPAIRATRTEVFCLGGPLNSPHVWAQQRLPAGGTRTVDLELPPGRYTLRAMQTKHAREFDVLPGEAEGTLSAGLSGSELRLSGPSVAGPRVKLELANTDGVEHLVRLEESRWTDSAATAALVTALQDFRDLFSREFLAPGEELALRSLSFLFTDLKGSTALYERVGDARAYVLVRDHFVILRRHIREKHGAVVKTMGDAVMAVFLNPRDALDAALAIQAEFLERLRAGEADVIVKLGLHAGACIAVTADEHLDYFGSTVNFAQRVQSESEGGDLVCSEGFLAQGGVRERLESEGGSSRPSRRKCGASRSR
ncbi:MAG: adenylate/guanylate cyclase domain-containing protein [Planctomycetota bacterium]|nr:adenylate/guanylate cyclase domain-containing protein [Planctomycetota bacterium]